MYIKVDENEDVLEFDAIRIVISTMSYLGLIVL